MKIGDRIKSKRHEMGLSQTELAQKIGVSKQTLYKYENNIITNIPSDKIECLSSSLDISPAYLMGWEESTENSHMEDTKKRLFTYYSALNELGKREAAKRIEELTHIDRYIKSSIELLDAAHEIPGATDDEKKHDDDIMDDENF